ncbi:hypothetical protein DPMN_049764 [Dreissena polymorpha]|uniref:Uncharacterized protein n=1 Tax=Dreissena polymorpha TaxID=45954 RepID=A0A9D4CGQ3_DREPO|nr:hypothetical protein DPMN_049764 [Dreissena polymorpha]
MIPNTAITITYTDIIMNTIIITTGNRSTYSSSFTKDSSVNAIGISITTTDCLINTTEISCISIISNTTIDNSITTIIISNRTTDVGVTISDISTTSLISTTTADINCRKA